MTEAFGFLGSYLVPFLLDLDYKIIGLTRNKSKQSIRVNLEWSEDLSELKTTQIDYVINFAGESIRSSRWIDK